MRTTAVLLVVLSVLLFLNVALPQVSIIGEQGLRDVVGTSTWKSFFLVTLRLGYLSSSPLFILVLGVFFLNLAWVLARRMKPTLRKLEARPRSEAGLDAWARTDTALLAPLPKTWSRAHLVDSLRGFGYRVERVGDTTFFGLKHRTAPIGFLLFHLSFFFLLAGGSAIYATRFVGVGKLSEGQVFVNEYQKILRTPIVGGPPSLSFRIEEVTPRLENGEAVYLGARLRFLGPDVEQTARINYPAQWGPVKVLINRAGVTAVLALRDESGYLLDRVAVPVAAVMGSSTLVPVLDGHYLVTIDPIPVGRSFPQREDLANHAIGMTVIRQGNREKKVAAETVFEGELKPGEFTNLGSDRLRLSELRYWVGFQVISERGGGILIAGFVVGVLGLIWRLMLCRREVAVTWDEEEGVLRLVGNSEYFPERFREEMQAILSILQREKKAS